MSPEDLKWIYRQSITRILGSHQLRGISARSIEPVRGDRSASCRTPDGADDLEPGAPGRSVKRVGKFDERIGERIVRKLACVLVAVSALFVATSFAAFAQDPTVGTNTTAALGTYLTTSAGRTLYTFNGDTSGVSNVSGQLATVWPPFRATAPLTMPAGVGGTLSEIARSDGTQQVAYNGLPLYTFVNDTAAGVVSGQGGAGGRFFVALAQASGAATATPVATSVAAATAVPGATATVTPAALPVTGSPGLPVAPTLLLAAGVVGLGFLLRRPTRP